MKKLMIRLICLFIPVKCWRKKTRQFLNSRSFSLSFLKKYFYKYKLFYFSDDLNFGDVLNKDLMRFLGIRYCAQPVQNANLVCIGSLLENFITSASPCKNKKPIHIWGSGFIQPARFPNESFIRPVRIHALRGELSKKRCEAILHQKLQNVVLGDPGLLTNRLFPNIHKSNRYDVGIICHYVDKDSPLLKKIKLQKLSYLLINVQQDTAAFVKQVTSCKFILSSAMHGLICADSFGIPNRQILLSDRIVGGTYKFRDYYSVFKNIAYPPPYRFKQPFYNGSGYYTIHKRIQNISGSNQKNIRSVNRRVSLW